MLNRYVETKTNEYYISLLLLYCHPPSSFLPLSSPRPHEIEIAPMSPRGEAIGNKNKFPANACFCCDRGMARGLEALAVLACAFAGLVTYPGASECE